MSDFVSGLYINKPNEKAPDFVKGGISINVEQFNAGLQDMTPDEKGYVRLQILESKDGSKWYATIDNWKPDAERAQKSAPPPAADEAVDDLPF